MQQIFPFLDFYQTFSGKDLCYVQYQEGNYTGIISKTGERHGWGEMRWNNGTVYGPDDLFYYSNGDKYTGQWINNIQHGIGTFVSRTGVYVGDWFQGLQQGNGTAFYHNGNKYTGQFMNGFKDGYGVFEATTGDVYTGYFRRGLREGNGIETYAGTGEKYVGTFQEDARNGQGTAYYNNGQVKYVGEWLNGSPHGNGTYVALNGDIYSGGFRNGVIVGPGTIIESSGATRIIQAGEEDQVTFRSGTEKVMERAWNFLGTIGLQQFFKKYVDFFYNYLAPLIGK